MGEDEGPNKRFSRRGLLTAGLVGLGGAGVAVEQGLLPGRDWLANQLRDDGPAGVVPDVEAGPTVSGTFVSAARMGATCGWAIAYPPTGSRDLPVLVVLHGRRADHTAAFADDYLGLGHFLAQAVQDGTPPFAVASVDGGDTYWHRRASGEDSGAMVTDEFLPLLSEEGLDTSRLGLFGWSMGGYGALLLGGRLGHDRVAAIAAVSPALWRDAGDTPEGAFDDADDFAAHTVFGEQERLRHIPVRVDCGTSDPFYSATVDYVDGLSPDPAGGFEPGGHDVDYWRREAPAQLAFLGHHLASPPG